MIMVLDETKREREGEREKKRDGVVWVEREREGISMKQRERKRERWCGVGGKREGVLMCIKELYIMLLNW